LVLAKGQEKKKSSEQTLQNTVSERAYKFNWNFNLLSVVVA